ncbi:hypothetical protein BDR26DRAFT_1011714 [Obelidium mucronatum]|nr:hypothetical protein BDR26DRAFT_1011714 [Obelidium mucronatum]
MPPPNKSSADMPLVFDCLWTLEKSKARCPHTFNTADELFIHLSEDHIGRKALGTLVLTCEWAGCIHKTRLFAKRDNAVSHVRSHVHFRANICKDCGSQFKWPQDLKKHCAKNGCEYVEPEFKGKPGPSPVFVVEAEDGSGPTLVRFGPSLTGGRQKAVQRRPTLTAPLKSGADATQPAPTLAAPGLHTHEAAQPTQSPSPQLAPPLSPAASQAGASPVPATRAVSKLPGVLSLLAGAPASPTLSPALGGSAAAGADAQAVSRHTQSASYVTPSPEGATRHPPQPQASHRNEQYHQEHSTCVYPGDGGYCGQSQPPHSHFVSEPTPIYPSHHNQANQFIREHQPQHFHPYQRNVPVRTSHHQVQERNYHSHPYHPPNPSQSGYYTQHPSVHHQPGFAPPQHVPSQHHQYYTIHPPYHQNKPEWVPSHY